jgi:pimeloyl-[acyl-carrier protein] methyl ester esterase
MNTAALVMLHGWALNLRVFDELVEQLEAPAAQPRFDITRLDLPGHGRAPEPSDLYGDQVEGAWDIGKVADLLIQQMPTRCILLGWSLGAKISMEIAARAPERIRGLVLISATPKFARSEDWPHGANPAALDVLGRHLRDDYRRTVSDFLSLQVRGSVQAEETLSNLRNALLSQGECQPATLLRSLRLLHQIDQRSRLPLITAPTLVIAGQYDRVVHPGATQATAAMIPNARYHELPRCGHAPFISHVHEVVELIQDFATELAA